MRAEQETGTWEKEERNGLESGGLKNYLTIKHNFMKRIKKNKTLRQDAVYCSSHRRL
jgi:hypothetical protein